MAVHKDFNECSVKRLVSAGTHKSAFIKVRLNKVFWM